MTKAMMPISPDLNALRMTYEEIQQQSAFQQQGLGIPNDVVQGMVGPDRETAHGAMLRKNAAMGRLAGESVQAEYQFIIPLAQRMKYYDQQFLTLPKQLSIIGPDAQMDPVTGYPIQNEDGQINYGDLDYDHKCRALGASRLISKEQMFQQLMQYQQMASTNPATLQITNWVNFTKLVAKALNLSATELLIPQAMIPQLNAQAAQQQAGGGAPGQESTPAGGPAPMGEPAMGGILNPADERVMFRMENRGFSGGDAGNGFMQ